LALQENVLDIIQARFGEVPYALRERILALADEVELKRLLRQAVLVQTLEQLSVVPAP
jgi:hypothetical protein